LNTGGGRERPDYEFEAARIVRPDSQTVLFEPELRYLRLQDIGNWVPGLGIAPHEEQRLGAPHFAEFDLVGVEDRTRPDRRRNDRNGGHGCREA
jgi:hypothetical protein